MSKTASGLSPSLLQRAEPLTGADAWEAEGRHIWQTVNRSAWALGDWWNAGAPYGDRVERADRIGIPQQTCRDSGWVAGEFDVSRRRDTLTWSHHREVAPLPETEQDAWLDRAEQGDGPDKRWSVMRLRQELKVPAAIKAPELPDGAYSTLVVDPPWEMAKISRDVRPRQKAMDYPAMTVEQISELDLPAAPNAHLYLWTTHKHLPDALWIAEAWGFNYQCVLTWVKNVGITPFSWMYSTELALFCRRGDLDLMQMGRRVDFAAKVREHSRKPDEFYDLVRDVSPGPRLDVFAREAHDGFDTWGNETERFAADA